MDGASNAGLMVASVTTAKTTRIAITTYTIRVYAFATTCEPAMFVYHVDRALRRGLLLRGGLS